MPSDTSQGVMQTSRGGSPYGGAFYSTTYSTQYTPKKAVNKNDIQTIAYTVHAQHKNSPSSSPHSQYYDWKDKRGSERFHSETKSSQQNVGKSHDTTNWMPPNRINNATAFVVANSQNVTISADHKNDYQSTTKKDYLVPVAANHMNHPIAHTLREQRTSYTINNICTAGLENHDLHLYDGMIDDHEAKQLQKYASARTGRPGAIGDNAFTRDAHLGQVSDLASRNARDTEYGQRYRADAPDSSKAYAAAVHSGYAASSPTTTKAGEKFMLPAIGQNLLASTRDSAFTKNDCHLSTQGTRSYITETGEKYQATKGPEYGIATSGSNSGFVNGHPMAQILSMNGNANSSATESDASHLARVKVWRQSHLNA